MAYGEWIFGNACLRAGNDEFFVKELSSLAFLALDPDRGSRNFREIYNPYTGIPDGGWQCDKHCNSCHHQTWSAAAYISMILHFCFVIILFLWFLCPAQELTRYVKPFIGTDGHGHTFPGATVPFGMVQLSPDTRVQGWDACGGYHYSDRTMMGFSHLHLSGVGVGDYGDILLMPTVGKAIVYPGEGNIPGSGYRSRFQHSREMATPGYYRVWLEDYHIQAELTVSQRVGFHRYYYPGTDSANIIIDLSHGLGRNEVLEAGLQMESDREISGWRRSSGKAKDQHVFFVAQFSKPFKRFGIVKDSIPVVQTSAFGKDMRGFVRFNMLAREPVLVKVGLSAVSIEGARRNIQAEIPGWDFERVKTDAGERWERELQKIKVSGGSPRQLTTFYTALYRSMIAPNLFNDADGCYRGRDGQVHEGKGFDVYSVFALWDTFRAEHPLLALINPSRTVSFINTFITQYEEGGLLPVWELWANESWSMIGYHSTAVICDAYQKGLRGFDVEKAWAAMEHSASADHFGLADYRKYGYVQAEEEKESVSKTLEYAYDDWCIAQMAKSLNKPREYDSFLRRAQNYKNVFDVRQGFMRGKQNGRWIEPFEATAVTKDYTEANAWQYRFFVPHDVKGLIQGLGGEEGFIRSLDELFESESQLTGDYKSDITGMIGQYAHGNEPCHHVAYLYHYAGAPWKTQQRVRTIMDSLYTDQPDGLCGNDDCGQLSAWYVLSAAGLYQVTPGHPVYCIGSPLFDNIVINLEDGKKFTITAKRGNPQSYYVHSARLNGQLYNKSYITHQTLLKGGTLTLIMDTVPQPRWGQRSEDRPPFPLMPTFVTISGDADKTTEYQFDDSVQVTLQGKPADASVHFTLDGQQPTLSSPVFSASVTLFNTTTVKALAVKAGMGQSKIANVTFRKK